jgi:transposase
MAEWLQEQGCRQVAMESTGSYWKPVYNILEGSFELVVVNSHHLKMVPGRKSDVRDAEWIAECFRHGLLRASNIPGREERELRELTRYRGALVRERASEVNRVQKLLEGANIKLGSVASNVMGVSGKAMLTAMVAGMDDASALAELARGKLRDKRADLEEALVGLVGEHQRFVLKRQLRRIAELDRDIDELSEEVERRLHPFVEEQLLLQTIPGVGRRLAETILSEVGPDISRFPTAGHLASWAGLCPGMNESAGRNRSGRTTRGSPWLRTALVQAAHAAAHGQTYLGAHYRRLRSRLGPAKAAVAVAHTILRIVWHLLSRHTAYTDLGPDYFDRHDRGQRARRLQRRLEHLGYTVTITDAA